MFTVESYRMPDAEDLTAFCRIVSLTDVKYWLHVLRVYAEASPIRTHKLPEDIFSSFINIYAACIFFKELVQWNLSEDATVSTQVQGEYSEGND
jgi:hypothetical protein